MHVILREAKDPAEPCDYSTWAQILRRWPWPEPCHPAQDDRLVEGCGSHNVFIQCLNGETQAMTDKGSTLKQGEGIALASFINKRGICYG
jgi:hypothetical protein